MPLAGFRNDCLASCSTEDLMIQLPDSPTDCAASDDLRNSHPDRLGDPTQTPQGEGADDSVPFVSPPPPVWPRIFPQL